ncbi:MAG: glycosyltransferase family 4 protein [Flavobacteriales bacterium]
MSNVKALIITYYWPPAGGPGVQRWLKFATYLSDFGVEPILYTPENPYYPIIDTELEAEIPKGITILKQPIKEPYGLTKLFFKNKTKKVSSGKVSHNKQSYLEKFMLWVRGNFFIPDARVAWVKPSVCFLEEYIKKNKVDVLVTTGPPHSLHLIGLELKSKTGISWLSDFRDPWTTIHYHASLKLTKSSAKKHKQLEANVLENADRIVVTSPRTKKEFKEITQQPIEVITNGYETPQDVNCQLDDKFSLVHIGSLLPQRNPILLWKVLSEICNSNHSFKKDFILKLIGDVSQEVIDSINSFGLNKQVEIIGYVSHHEAIKYQHKAQVLLLIEMDKPETRCIIPGKLFEYIVSKRPIIAIGPRGSDVYSIIYQTQSGSYFTYQEEASLHQQIITLYKQYKKGNLTVSSINIEKYHRKNLSEKMAQLIKSLHK